MNSNIFFFVNPVMFCVKVKQMSHVHFFGSTSNCLHTFVIFPSYCLYTVFSGLLTPLIVTDLWVDSQKEQNNLVGCLCSFFVLFFCVCVKGKQKREP